MIYVYSLKQIPQKKKQIPQTSDNLLKLLIQVIEYIQEEMAAFKISIVFFAQKIFTECLHMRSPIIGISWILW